ncbi:MAG: hypothetical protein RLZZ386_122 [Planctomycetota bacterium]
MIAIYEFSLEWIVASHGAWWTSHVAFAAAEYRLGHPDGGANLVLAQDGVAWISGSTARDDQRTSNE